MMGNRSSSRLRAMLIQQLKKKAWFLRMRPRRNWLRMLYASSALVLLVFLEKYAGSASRFIADRAMSNSEIRNAALAELRVNFKVI